MQHLRHQIVSQHRAMGRSTADIWCPICGTVTRAFVWSWAGHGFKRCGNAACQARLLASGAVEPGKMLPGATSPPPPAAPAEAPAGSDPSQPGVPGRLPAYSDRVRVMDQAAARRFFAPPVDDEEAQ